jgi:cationic amino acid transporter 1
MKHTATPEFAQWAADNAHRVRVERDDASEDETIESSSSSSKETEEVDKASGLFRWLWYWTQTELAQRAAFVHGVYK